MAFDPESGRPLKRFKHQSYQASLKTLHLPSAASQSNLDDDIPDSESHFQHALEHCRQINLGPVFLRFAAKVSPLSASVPLLLHHSSEIVQLWIGAVKEADDDSLKALFDLFQKLIHDLRATLQTHYTQLLEALLINLPRSPQADALTVLLSTLSLFFKHLLGSTAKETLQESWDILRTIIPKCNPEVQRAFAEVWATVLRRCEGDTRMAAVNLILRDLTTVSDFGAWAFVHAFKSVVHTLHTCTAVLFEGLLDAHLLLEDPLHSQVMLQRVTTAMIHHCDKAEQFTAMSNVLITRFVSSTSTRLMILLSTMASVRKGSRLSQSQISKILAHLAQRQMASDEEPHMIALGAACLVAGEMPIWMGPGRKFIEVSWEKPLLAMKLAGVLSALNWGGWRLLELPYVSKYTCALLGSHPLPTLALLASLAEAGRLDDAGEYWLKRISETIQKRLSSWVLEESNLPELTCILSLSQVLHTTITSLIPIASLALHFDPKTNPEVSDNLCAQVFGASVKALAQDSQALNGVDISLWIITAVKKWPQSQIVLEGLVALAKWGKSPSKIAIAELYEHIQKSVLSHQHALRLHALRLLTSNIVDAGQSDSLLRACLRGEEATLDVQGVRDRVLRITSIPQIVRTDDRVGCDAALRWLIAQLQVNLRPLWSQAIKAISALSDRFAETVWSMIFFELTTSVQGKIERQPLNVADANNDPSLETERSWKDPSAAKFRSVMDLWLQSDPIPTGIFSVRNDRLDLVNYEHQLLIALGEMPSLTQRHNAELIRLFLTFGSPELPVKPPKTKLLDWLTLFSKLDNPKAFHKTATLRHLHRSLLSHPDHSLQSIALTCLMNYKEPFLISYESGLRGLLDPTRWRDELTNLDFSLIEERDRAEIMGVIIRLFFGIMLDRHGKTKGKAKRASLLGTLSGCREEELRVLVDLMLEPFGLSSLSTDIPDKVDWTDKQQAGFLNFLGDVMKRMAPRIISYWPSLILATTKCVAMAQNKLVPSPEKPEDEEEIVDEDEVELDVAGDDNSESFNPRAVRALRQIGVRRLTDFFRGDVSFDFTPYMPSICKSIISPRLAALERENTQVPSALLGLFYAWSSHEGFVRFLVDYDDRILPKLYLCLQAPSVKPAVISRIFDIIEHILVLSSEQTDIAQAVIQPHMSTLLDALTLDLSGASASGLLHRQVGILSQIAAFTSSELQARRLLQYFAPLLKRTSKIIPEKTKVHLLKIIGGIIPMIADFHDHSSHLYMQTYETVSKLFRFLHGRAARVALLEVFGQFGRMDPLVERVSGLLTSLNAFSVKRIDEPDFERRLEGFNTLNESLYSELSIQEWMPLLYNMLLFIQDPEELVIRTNAAYSLKRFIDVLATREDLEVENIFMRVLFPALKHGLLCKVELVRNEILGVLAYGIEKCDKISSLKELRPLLAGGDVEANFFNNIHHIQVHRRTRALRRLSEYVATGGVRSATIAELFLPLIGHVIVNASNMDHILVDVVIATTGALARHLAWGSYHDLVKQYMSLVKSKTSSERACVRTLVAILQNFHFPMEEVLLDNQIQEPDKLEEQGDEVEDPTETIEIKSSAKHATAVNAGSTKKIADAVNSRLLPALLKHLEGRNDNEDSLRIPVSVGIAQVACHLPETFKHAQISRLLTIISQVFRSKSQDTRVLARETLCKVAVIIGPSYLPNIMTELRAALLRGSHLHVLATVAHALMVHITSGEAASLFRDLDSCAADVAHVSAEVIFGQSGNNSRSEGFTTTILEVKGSSSKGLDSYAILARHITPSQVSVILQPIRAIMQETAAAKTMQLVDDVLRRISSGLNANKHLSGPDYLSLCHTFIQQNSLLLKDAPRSITGNDRRRKGLIVQMKRRQGNQENHYAHNSFRFVVLGLDLFNVAFRRGRFNMQDPEILSRLEAMVPVIGNTLFSQEGAVVIQGLRSTALIVKCPLKAVDEALPVFVKQTMHTIRQAGNTESEMVQTAFRTLVVIIRDCRTSEMKEKDLSYLLEVIAVDLEEPERQAAVFALLRAIISRKFIVVEVYDMIDKVQEIMVTSQSEQVQEVCRAVLLQFLLDYPQGKGRLKKQMAFLAKNLSYIFESGRKSVMELLGAIFLKFDSTLLREYADLFFVALVMVLANDDSSKCREMAAELIKLLLKQTDMEHRKVLISHLHTWSSGETQVSLARVSAQVSGLVVDALQQDIAHYVSLILADMSTIITRSAVELQKVESSFEELSMDVDIEWQLPYHALNTTLKLLRVQGDLPNLQGDVVWSAIGQHLLFPHAWVRNVSARLVGVLFSTVPPRCPDPTMSNSDPLSLPGLIDMARCSCLQLKSETLDDSLSLQIVKNLLYVGKTFCFISAALPIQDQKSDDTELDSEPQDKMENIRKNPLPWLFSKLSYQIRSAYLARRNRTANETNWSEQPMAVFRWFAAMATYMDAAVLENYLVHVLNPTYRITDDDTIHDKAMDDLKTLAQELIELIQNKVGTTRFGEVYNAIRQNIASVRRERKTEKAILATKDPQAAAQRKIVRNQIKKNNRAKVLRSFAETKVRNNSTKVRRRT